MSNSNIDDILAALANYVVESIHLQPTPVEMIKLNQRQAKQAIQQELLKARIETLEWLLEQEVEFGGLELKQSIIDKVADLQKELKENNDG